MKYNAVVIGAGPAGLSAAKILTENNKKILVLEKDSYVGNKVCAEGITQKTKPLMPNSVIEKAYSSIKIHSPLQSIVLKQKEPFLWMINRNKLAKWQLNEAEKAGAEILFDAKIKKINKNNLMFDNKNVCFDYFIGADGSSSLVRKIFGIKTRLQALGMQYIVEENFKNVELILNYKKFGPWYAWIFPHRNYSYIGVGSFLNNKNIQTAKKNLNLLLESRGINYKNAKFQAALLNADYRGFKFGNLFLAGDAAGFVSELTGEGIYQAIVSGQETAKGIINPNYDYPKIKEILDNKRIHKKIVAVLNQNRILTNILHEITVLCLRNHWLLKKITSIV